MNSSDSHSSQLLEKLTFIISSSHKASTKAQISGLLGSAPSYLLGSIISKKTAPLMIVTSSQETSDEIYRELCFFAGESAGIALFPAWDCQPFSALSPHPDIISKRLDTLFRLHNSLAKTVVVPITALMQRVIPRSVIESASSYLVCGEESERDELLKSLIQMGYAAVPLVEDRGTFAVRGGILDIFPPNVSNPVRIEFFSDTVETMRMFDPLTQRSLQPLEELVLLPSRELLLTEDILKELPTRLKKICDDCGVAADRRRALLADLQNAVYFHGVDYLQPLLHPNLETLFDYCSDAALVVIDSEAVESAAVKFSEELIHADELATENRIPHSPNLELFLNLEEFGNLKKGRATISMGGLALHEDIGASPIEVKCQDNSDLKVTVSKESGNAMAPFCARLEEWWQQGLRTLIVCHQEAQLRRMLDLLEPYKMSLEEVASPNIFFNSLNQKASRTFAYIAVGDVCRGFRLPESGIVMIAEEELFGKRVRRSPVSEVRKKQILSSLADLKPGDFMVHIDHGIARYAGLQHLVTGAVAGDFLLLEYSGNDKLYLPIDRLALVQRYVGPEGSSPSLDKLGGVGWEKSKGKAKKAIEELAGELLEIYAKRQMCEGHAFSPPDEMYREFEASFAWEETPDQLSAIEDVLSDMQHSKPMDRLVCGDVGYGKTEVALRGAVKAALDGKQVGVLVPTTILAQQHYETFHERLKDYPITVEVLSRFRTPKELKATLEGLKKGTVDIVIGTHRLLQKDVVFKDLGLLIIDEEQRFGVKDKERLKTFRAVVDVMTLSATPIPRTLYMSMMGIRDLSIIDTPPVDRLAVKTFVSRFSEDLIREAVMREIRRGGQVFFVHNRVQTIAKRAELLAEIVPEAKISVGHGQMDEHELEKVMLGFMHGETNLLICTTIIESGLDIPNANTLIVDRADTFGLSQLYQLRGRVGRSTQRGYAYLLIPGETTLTADARERLRILQDISELGAGFRIATHDMEIRGAGDVLGNRQSGTVTEIGFELYTQMLEETISRLRGENIVERVEPEINLRVPAFIPEVYVKDTNQRLVIYKRLTQAENEDDIMELEQEVTDRFGSYPMATNYLFETMRIRIMLKKLAVRQIDFDGKNVVLTFHPSTSVSPDTIIKMVRGESKKYQFTQDYRLICTLKGTAFEDVLYMAKETLRKLQI